MLMPAILALGGVTLLVSLSRYRDDKPARKGRVLPPPPAPVMPVRKALPPATLPPRVVTPVVPVKPKVEPKPPATMKELQEQVVQVMTQPAPPPVAKKSKPVVEVPKAPVVEPKPVAPRPKAVPKKPPTTPAELQKEAAKVMTQEVPPAIAVQPKPVTKVPAAVVPEPKPAKPKPKAAPKKPPATQAELQKEVVKVMTQEVPPAIVVQPTVKAQPVTPPPVKQDVISEPKKQVIVAPPVEAPKVPEGFDADKARKTAPRIAKHLTKKGIANYSRQALREFQKLAGIDVDGIYGGESYGALRYYLRGTGIQAPRPFFKPIEEKPYTLPGA